MFFTTLAVIIRVAESDNLPKQNKALFETCDSRIDNYELLDRCS